ncbi:MAG TPA: HAD family hydrolase [Chloroflexi bacterium]|nr:HAD family hydrolase [Chloroflexota bacterium]
MIELSIPGRGEYRLEHIVFDVNGTLACDGHLIEGVAERLRALSERCEIHLLTADTHGRQSALDAELGLVARRIQAGHEREQKAAFVYQLGAEKVVAVGNGGNDVGMLQAAAVGIAVLESEGLNVEALQAADIVVRSALDALDLLLNPRRLLATLRR